MAPCPGWKTVVYFGHATDICNADVVIVPVPMSSDNYCYLIIDQLDKTAVLIDAADPEAVQVKYKKYTFAVIVVFFTHILFV